MMSYAFESGRLIKTAFLAIMVLVIMLLGSMHAVGADGHGGGHGDGYRGGHGGGYRFYDTRYNHRRYYPARGRYVYQLPHGYRMVFYHNSRYFFYGGVWYHPEGGRFVIIAPPFGLFVPFLPFYYTTIWVGGVPYYYANDVYYMQSGNGYVVTEPPEGDVSQSPPVSDQLFIYPRQGQGEKKQADDRFECHRWAVGQTKYDPTQPPAGVSESQAVQKRADYNRAMAACLDGRGYTVK